MDLAQLQALVDQQGQVIAQLQQQQQPVQQPAPVQFALSPAQATMGIIDFTTSDGKKIFAAATKRRVPAPGGAQNILAVTFLHARTLSPRQITRFARRANLSLLSIFRYMFHFFNSSDLYFEHSLYLKHYEVQI